jgi:Zn-dependent peptidase ImmA (M78 family)
MSKKRLLAIIVLSATLAATGARADVTYAQFACRTYHAQRRRACRRDAQEREAGIGKMKPRIGYARVRRRALELLEGQHTPPVSLETVAEMLGAEIREVELEHDVSGVLFRGQGRKVIAVNKAHTGLRKRFTIAHELGHLALHKGAEVHVDQVFRINLRDARSATAQDVEEIEANAFAANLLIPAQWIRADLAGSPIDLENEGRIGALAERYQVSAQAMIVRLRTSFLARNGRWKSAFIQILKKCPAARLEAPRSSPEKKRPYGQR